MQVLWFEKNSVVLSVKLFENVESTVIVVNSGTVLPFYNDYPCLCLLGYCYHTNGPSVHCSFFLTFLTSSKSVDRFQILTKHWLQVPNSRYKSCIVVT